MATPEEEELYSHLDFWLLVVCALISVCFVVSYAVMPMALPNEPRVGPVAFFFGSSCLKYVRRPGEPPLTEHDFPDTGKVSEEYNIELFAAQMSEMWETNNERTLFRKIVWRILPWWIYTMAMSSAERLMSFVQTSYIVVVLLTMLTSETVPDFGPATLKLMLIGFVIAVGKEGINKWCKLILALRGTDPIYSGLSLLIVQKLQRLSSTGMLQTNSAEAQQVAQECYWIAVSLWASPLATAPIDLILGAVSLKKLYNSLGIMGLVTGFGCIALCQGVGWLCDMKRRDIDVSNFEVTVRRQITLNTMLDNFRELRLYDWVKRVAKPLDGVRDQMRKNYLWSSFYNSINGVVGNQMDGIVTILTCYFIVFIRKERVDFKEAQVARAYMATLLYIVMSLSMCRWSVMDMVQKAGRIERFLRLPEVDNAKASVGPLEVKGGTFAYPVPKKFDEDGKELPPADPVPVLSGIDLKIGDGELVLVCGAISAGKSSLLQALLGELPALEGERWVPDTTIAYQPQVPYLIEGTIRENILFGITDEDKDEKHLRRALAAAQILTDIKDPGSTLNIKGDETNVGKRGTHLSGGQRARTALARTIYAVLQGAKLALLDDPVASVDNEVLQAAWEEAVLGEMKGATRVVVVNSQLLERLAATADRLVVLSEGKMVYNGPPAEAFADQEILSKALSGKYEMGTGAATKQVYTWLPKGLGHVKDFLAFFGNPSVGDVFTQEHLDLVNKGSPTPQTFEYFVNEGCIKIADPKDLKEVYTWLPKGLAAVKDVLALFGNPSEGDVFTQEHLDMVNKSSPTPQTFEHLVKEGFIKIAEPKEVALQTNNADLDLPNEEEEESGGEDAALVLADMLRESDPLREFLRCSIPNPAEGEDKPLAVSEAPLKLNPDEWDDLRLKLRRIERQFKHKEQQGKPKMTAPQLVCHFLYVSCGIFAICMMLNVGNSFRDAVVLATISRWSARGDEESDSPYLLKLIGVFLGFSMLGVLIGQLDGYGALRLGLHLMGKVDESLISLGMPFFWRKRSLAEPHVRKVVNQDVMAMANIARLPCMCVECLILISVTSFQAPLLWVLMPISFFGYYKMSFLPDWRNLQLWPVREQLQNTAWAKVVEMWDVLPAIRGLRREQEFQRTTHKGLMVIGYTNVMQFQLDVLQSFCHHTIGAVFNAVALAILIRLRISGATTTTAFAFWTLASNFNEKLNQMVMMYMPFRELLKQYEKMQDIFCSDTLETIDGAEPPSGFPSDGKIEFDRVTFRYVAYLPPALQDVSLTVHAGENLGVVGKTGSGKSTLVSLLLRLGPLKGVAPNSGGRVLLDGVDISTLRLSDVRKSVAVVPQEPTLFAMTLKDNIGEEFTDAEVLTALQWCGLDARQITGKEDGPIADVLEAYLSPGGLSVGQQQLLMAARALVRRPKILILDECTASLDRESADRLLEVLSSHSKGITVLSIAHRLRFVLKSDRILVLSMGHLVACDTPAKLLEETDGYFATNLRYEQLQDQS